jgi:hypothetical protein
MKAISGSAGSNVAFSSPALNSVPRGTSEAFSRTLAFRAAPSWMHEVSTQIQALANLGPNWNSYGASAALPESIEAAEVIIAEISKIVGVDQPDICLSPDGNVAATWEFSSPRSQLDVEVLGSGIMNFAYTNLDRSSKNADYAGATSDYLEIARILSRW